MWAHKDRLTNINSIKNSLFDWTFYIFDFQLATHYLKRTLKDWFQPNAINVIPTIK